MIQLLSSHIRIITEQDRDFCVLCYSQLYCLRGGVPQDWGCKPINPAIAAPISPPPTAQGAGGQKPVICTRVQSSTLALTHQSSSCNLPACLLVALQPEGIFSHNYLT